jgi:GNAT superfamily N-acetyltransferase
MSLRIRELAPSDSLDALTSLLHRAYAPLGAAGMNYTAVDQSIETTAQRLAGGQGFVAEQDGAVVGTVVVQGPRDADAHPDARVCAWYLRRDLAHLHQLGVEPAAQGRGIGGALIAACEEWARERGSKAIALDTAMPATHLRERYAALGYADVGDVQWSGKRYRTVIMVKPLTAVVPSEDDTEHRCALVRAMWAHVQAPVTRERFDGGDLIVRVNSEYPEGWTLSVKAVDALADGRVHALVEVAQDGVTYFNHSRCTFAGARIAEIVEHWATGEAPPAWRTAERLGAGYHRG